MYDTIYKCSIPLIVIPKNIIIISKRKELVKMIKDEEYIAFLKSIISCISHGDYYSVKELSNLELERVNKKIEPKFCELLYKKEIETK